VLTDDAIIVQGGEGEVSIGRKEKSVLQAKLTKLAIQIGYGGTSCIFLSLLLFFRMPVG